MSPPPGCRTPGRGAAARGEGGGDTARAATRRRPRVPDPRAPDGDAIPPGGPIRRSKCGYTLTTDQSDAGSVGIFSRRTNQTQEAWVYSHDRPIRRRKRAARSHRRDEFAPSEGGVRSGEDAQRASTRDIQTMYSSRCTSDDQRSLRAPTLNYRSKTKGVARYFVSSLTTSEVDPSVGTHPSGFGGSRCTVRKGGKTLLHGLPNDHRLPMPSQVQDSQ
eukprot:2559986-Pyramimonas_sp.AAC.1